MKVRLLGLVLVFLILGSSILARTQSTILDPQSNLQGDQARTFLDIVESNLILKDDFYTFNVIMSSPFPSIVNMKDKRIDIIWFVDIDRNKKTGQSHMGNDYNIHLYLSENGWRSSWYKVTEKSRNDGIQVKTKDFRINVKGNRASLSFPKFYLPSHSFDWWVYAGTGNSPNWIPITENPHTERATFNSDMDIEIPSRNGLIAYFPFNGNAKDESGHIHHGRIFGARLSEDRFGNANGAYYFDGDDYIVVGNLGIIDDWTVAFWINSNSVENHRNPFDANFVLQGNNAGPRFEQYSNGELFFIVGTSQTNYTYASLGHISVGNWYHIAVVKSGNKFRLYLNGDKFGEQNNLKWPKVFSNVNIGRGWAARPKRYFIGAVDDVVIYNRALTDMDIRSLCNFNINDYQEYNYFKSEIFKLTDNPFGIQDVEPAILQTKEGNIWLIWRHQDLQLYYKVSNDNGNTWSASHYLTDWGNNLSPSIIQTADGRIWVVWCGDRNGWYIFYRVTSNNGRSWSPIQKIETSLPHGVHPAVIETMDRKLWIFWGDYVTSNDGGKSWSSRKRPFAPLPFNSSLCQTSDGRLWVVGWTGSQAAYSVSEDNGHTWSSKVYIGKASPGGAVAPEVVQSSDGKIWITWHSNHGGNEDIYYVVSKDNGTTWSTSYKMTRNVTKDSAPDVAEINNKIWTVWCSNRDGDYEIYSKIIANVEAGNGPLHFPERFGQIHKDRIKQQLDSLLSFSSFNDPIQYLNHIDNLKRFFNSNLEILYPGKLLIEEVLEDVNDNAGIKHLNIYPKARSNIVLSTSYNKYYKIPVPNDNSKPSYFKKGVLYDYFIVENSYGLIPLDDLRHKGYIEKLISIRQSNLYDLKKKNSNTYQCKFIRCLKVSNNDYCSDCYKVSSYIGDSGNKIGLEAGLLSNRELQDVLERTKEIWIENEIHVNKNGIPLEKPGECVRPIALKTDKNYYLVQENFNYKFRHLYRISDLLGFSRSAIYPLSSKNEKGETRINENLTQKVIFKLINILKNKFKSDPFNAYIDDEWPDMLIMTREKEKSKLLNGKYEITGYLMRVSQVSGGGIELYIRYNVLTANHPEHNFYDPSDREFNNYKKAIQKTKEEVIDNICKEFNFARYHEWKLKMSHDGGEK